MDVVSSATFIGVDLHKDTRTARVIAAKDRNVAHRKIARAARERVHDFLAYLLRPRVVVIETAAYATYFSGY